MTLKLKKGLDLALEGAVGPDSTVKNVEPVTCAVVPDDFPGFTPKLDVKEGVPPFSALESAIVVLFYRYSACLAREVPSAHV